MTRLAGPTRAGVEKKKHDFTSIDCPECAAKVGERCQRKDGRPGPFPLFAHKDRVSLVKYGVDTQGLLAIAAVSYASELNSNLGGLACCTEKFLTFAALDAHVDAGHVAPAEIGLIPSPDGWGLDV
jgi:hypothetical protein